MLSRRPPQTFMVLSSNHLFASLTLVGTLVGGYATPVLDARQSESNLPSGWVALGCYSDSTTQRTLSTAAFTDVNAMTIESCIAFCTPSSYRYAGVEFSRECYCDNIIESPGAPITDSICDIPCTGNATETCGGAGGINIFQNTAIPPPPPPATIKQSVGTFQYKGCFDDGVDGAPRSLSNKITVSAGVTAESCTVACKAAGYALAGLEFGQECWCDSYMPLAIHAPYSDCNMACQADTTEICGAGNRLAVYQDTSATPPDVQQCLTNSQLHVQTQGFRFNLLAVPSSGSGTSLQIGSFELPAQAGQPSFFLLSSAVAREAFTYTLGGNVLFPDDFEGSGNPIPIAPTPGGEQVFAAFSTLTAFAGYCAKPNPVSTFGPFIGPPVLSVNGHADLWASCGIAPIIYSPISGSPLGYNVSQCISVFLQMTQPIVTF